MTALSVIGIDFGNESCYVAVAKAGGIETIANDYSLRATPTCIAFSEKNRVLGVAAKNQQITNIRNTIFGMKRLLGRSFHDVLVQNELKHLPFQVQEMEGGKIGIKVNYLSEDKFYTPEQCVAMLFTKLKETSSAALQTPIKDCVISVPSYYTQAERQALKDAAEIADLNVLCLLNETTATALTYGIYKQDLPPQEEKPRNVIFVDCGYASLQVSACAFHKGQLKMIATASDPNFGGRDIDFKLAEYFAKEFTKKYRIDVGSNKRAMLRLLAEVEKLKKQMSANSTMLPLNIECFMEDIDVHGDMKREQMEVECKELFENVRKTLKRCLDDSGLTQDDIHAVEIVGGSSRVPAIKQMINEIFGRQPSTTLNQDEAVARGCALQCAMLSPAVRVRDFKVTDVMTYDVSVRTTNPDEEEQVLPRKYKVPVTRKLNLRKAGTFDVFAYYAAAVPYPTPDVGRWTVELNRPSDGKPTDVKCTFKVDISGIVTMRGAALEEVVEVSASETPMDVDSGNSNADQNGENGNEQQQQQQQQQQQPAAPENGEEKKKKKTTKTIELPVKVHLRFGLSEDDLNKFKGEECQLIANDKREKDRADARNALEEYVYELRGKLSSDDELAPYILENARRELIDELDKMENWLYEDGEGCDKSLYKEKLQSLKVKGDPVEKRRHERENRRATLDEFSRALKTREERLNGILSGKAKNCAHITKEELGKVEDTIKEYKEKLHKFITEMHNWPQHKDPIYTVSDIKKEVQNFLSLVDPTLEKPAPKEQTPPKEATSNESSGAEHHADGQQQQQQQQQNHNGNEGMETD